MHYRQSIRDAVADLLIEADTVAGTNVFTSRARPILEILQNRQSVLSVYTGDETSRRTGDAYLLERTLTVSIEGAMGGGDDLDDLLDDLCMEVEAAIDADPALSNLLSEELELTATTSEISARGNQQVGAFRLDYQCKYLTERVSEGEPGTLPTKVYTTPRPDADAYTELFESLQPEPCEDGTCNTPAWGGDLTDESFTPVSEAGSGVAVFNDNTITG